MIYLDSAATSLQKPRSVERAMMSAMRSMASPGRGGHRPAMLAADMAFDCRAELAGFFHMENPERIIFTMNATHALNIAIHSCVRRGDRVIVSGFEHNAVVRPLHTVGAEVKIAASPMFEPQAAIEAFAKNLPGADIAVCCHVSNVFGYVLPLPEIAQLCRQHGVTLIVDASQSAGVLDINFPQLGAEYIAMPGHKGLLGPQGTGVLVCRDSALPLMQGGTGSNSAAIEMPDFLPDRLEAGTHNITGIAGLLAGVRYVRENGTKKLLRHERDLGQMLAKRLMQIPGMEVFRSEEPTYQTGVLSVRHRDITCEELAERLGANGVAIRAGLHCSPTAHRTADTFDTGTARFSFSPFNTMNEIQHAAALTAEIVNKE